MERRLSTLMQKHLEKLNGLIKYGVAAILLAVPLYPKFPFLRIPGVAVAIRLEDFVIFVVFSIWILAALPKIKLLLKNKIVIGIMLFLAVGLVSVLWGILAAKTVVPYVGLLHWARRVEYLAAFFIGLYSLQKKENLYFYIKILFVVVVFAFFYGVGQKYFNIPIITTQNEDYARGVALRWRPEAHLVSTFAGHYDLASFLILMFPALYLFATSPKDTLKKLIPDTNTVLTRFGIIAVLVMALWLLMQTASRISLVSYLGSSIFALILMRRKKFIPVVLVVSFAFAMFSMNLIDRYKHIIDVYAQEEERVEEVVVHEDRSTSIRLNVEWPRAIRALTKNPLTGTGYSSISLATDNDYLRMLGETGILGFISFFTFFGWIAFSLFKSLPKSNSNSPSGHFVAGIFATIPGVMLNMVFIDILEASKFAIMFWLLLGISIALVSKKNEKFN